MIKELFQKVKFQWQPKKNPPVFCSEGFMVADKPNTSTPQREKQ